MKLSEFKGDKGIEVVGKLLLPVSNIAANKEVTKAMRNGGLPQMLSSALINCPKDIREMLAILNDKPVEEYEVNGATILADVFLLFEDEALLRLFGLQS